MTAKVLSFDLALLRRDLRQSLDVNSCIAKAQELRRQAAELTAAGRDEEATSTLFQAARIERHAKCLVAARELARDK
jgi:hypothetical protein